jgi:hypothetical protein
MKGAPVLFKRGRIWRSCGKYSDLKEEVEGNEELLAITSALNGITALTSLCPA